MIKPAGHELQEENAYAQFSSLEQALYAWALHNDGTILKHEGECEFRFPRKINKEGYRYVRVWPSSPHRVEIGNYCEKRCCNKRKKIATLEIEDDELLERLTALLLL